MIEKWIAIGWKLTIQIKQNSCQNEINLSMTKVKCVESLFTLSYVKTADLWEYFQKLYKIAHKNMN